MRLQVDRRPAGKPAENLPPPGATAQQRFVAGSPRRAMEFTTAIRTCRQVGQTLAQVLCADDPQLAETCACWHARPPDNAALCG